MYNLYSFTGKRQLECHDYNCLPAYLKVNFNVETGITSYYFAELVYHSFKSGRAGDRVLLPRLVFALTLQYSLCRPPTIWTSKAF
jgi:hypothetical protein